MRGLLAESDPALSGYGDAMGNGAVAECMDDLDALFGGIDAPWVTRFEGRLSQGALAEDLQLQAVPGQSTVPRSFFITESINSPCGAGSGGAAVGGGPMFAGSGGDTGVGPSGSGGAPSSGAASNADGATATGGGCSCSMSSSPGSMGLAGLAFAALLARRRPRKSTHATPTKRRR